MKFRTPLRIRLKRHMTQHAQAWLAGLFALIVGAASVAAASSFSNTVNVGPYQGKPVVLRNGREIPVTVGMTLQARDRIVTDGDSRLAIDMGEDSMLMVGEDSEVALTALHVSDANRGGIKAIVELPRGVARFMTPVAEVQRPRRIRMVLGDAKYRIGKSATDAWFKHANPTNVGCLFDGAIEVFIDSDKVADVGDPRFCFIHNLSADELPIRVIDEDQQRALIAQTDIVPDTVMVAAAPQREIYAEPVKPIVPAKPALKRPDPVVSTPAAAPVQPRLPSVAKAPAVSRPIQKPARVPTSTPASKPTATIATSPASRPPVATLPSEPSALSYAPARVNTGSHIASANSSVASAKPLTRAERIYQARLEKARRAALRYVKARGYTPLSTANEAAAAPRVAAIVPTKLPMAQGNRSANDWRLDNSIASKPRVQVNRNKPQPIRRPQAAKARTSTAKYRPSAKDLRAKGTWHVNLASFSNYQAAQSLVGKLRRLEVPVEVMPFNKSGRKWYRVYLDVKGQRKDAERAGKALVGNFGIRGYWVKKK